MADRTVSVQLRADVAAYIAAMRAAAAATRDFGDSADEAGRRASRAFHLQRRSSERLEEAMRRLMEAQREQGQQQEQNNNRQEEHTRRTNENSDSQDRNTRAMGRSNEQFNLSRGTMVSLIAAAVGVGAAVVSAAVAFTVFAGVAAPAVINVMRASGDLTTRWDTLTTHQKASTITVRKLADEFKNLAHTYEPQALNSFNTIINTTTGILPRLGDVISATGGDVQQFIAKIMDFVGDRIGGEFLTWVSRSAPKALDVLGDTLTITGDTMLDLIQDIEPLGVSLLQLTNGTLSVVNGVAQVNPAFAQLAIGALLLRRPVGAVVRSFGSMTGGMTRFRTATAGATLATKALHLVKAAGPVLYVAAAAGLLYFAAKAMQTKSATEKLTETLRIEHRATGNNLAGHQALTAELERNAQVIRDKVIRAQLEMSDASRAAIDPAQAQLREISKFKKELQETEEQLRKQREITDKVATGAQLLADKYSITEEQAISFATAAGVDLSQAIDKNGKLIGKAAIALDQYSFAVEQGLNPTKVLEQGWKDLGNTSLVLTDRVKGLQAAFNAFLTPSLAVFDSVTKLKGGFSTLREALNKAEGGYRGNTASSRALRTALSEQIKTVTELGTSVFNKTKNDNASRAAMVLQLPQLYALTKGNRDARAQVDLLAKTLGVVKGKTDLSRESFLLAARAMGVSESAAEKVWRELGRIPAKAQAAENSVQTMTRNMARALLGLPDEGVRVSVFANGKWEMGAREAADKFRGATGGPVPWTSGAVAGRDSVPALLMPDEHVITTREVNAAGGHSAIYRWRRAMLRGELRGFAGGGSFNITTRVPDSGEIKRSLAPVGTLEDVYVRAWIRVAAAAWKKYAGSGGPALGWARSQAGKPYVWGGVGPGGYDCSGFTSAITNVLQGRSPYSRRHTTHSFGLFSGPDGFIRSAPSKFIVGVTDAGVGHMAGTLGGVAVESSGSAGVRVGGGARGANHPMFTRRYGLTRFATGGPVTADLRDLAGRALRSNASSDEVKTAANLGLIGDPSSLISPTRPAPRGYAGGGWVRGNAGRDRVPIRATAGEFLVNKTRAMQHAPLLESINSGRGGGGDVHLHLNNQGVIGSRIELENWLTHAVDDLYRQQRLPAGR